jgi:hypothetical protein
MRDAENHVLRLLYNTLRSARLNERFYYTRYTRLRQMDLVLDLYMAISATALTALVTSLGDSSTVRLIASFLALQISVIAVAKPITRSSDSQGRSIYLYRSFARIRIALTQLADQISASHKIPADLGTTLSQFIQEIGSLSVEDDPHPRKSLLVSLQDEVNREFPVDRFWWPDDRPEDRIVPAPIS